MSKRRLAVEETRERILDAARRLIVAPGGFDQFTMEAVAREAGVARMTVYNQFSSKPRLLEAMFEFIRTRGRHDELAEVWKLADPLEMLTDFVARIARIWGGERVLFQRLYALAALDPDFARVLRPRMDRRRAALGELLESLNARYGTPSLDARTELANLLYSVVSFDTFDALAQDGESFEAQVPVVLRLARHVVGLPLDETVGETVGAERY